MDIRNFKTFQGVVDYGGFTKAAQQLGYAQSTVTSHIKAIEDYYNKQLFDRMGKKIVLTQFGSELIDHVRILLHEYDTTCNMSQLFEKPQGKLSIGMPESILIYRVHSIIKKYKERYPEVDIAIEMDTCPRLREKLQNGELDISFFLQPTVHHKSLSTNVLRSESFSLVAPKDYNQPELKPSADTLVLYTESGSDYGRIMEDYFKSIDFFPRNTLEMNSIEAIKKYILSGIGITLLPTYSIQEDAKQGLLKSFDCSTYTTYYSQISVHEKKWINPAMKAFIQMTIEDAKGW